jgi:chemotaxis protein CheX
MSTYTPPTDDDLRVITEQVWASYLDLDGGSPLLPIPAAKPAEDVLASVSVTGAWQGHVVIRCTEQASRRAAGALLGVELDDVTAAELANIIGGNVKSMLPEPCVLSLPHVIVSGAGAVWPAVVEVCQISGTWLDESIIISVLESHAERVGAA